MNKKLSIFLSTTMLVNVSSCTASVMAEEKEISQSDLLSSLMPKKQLIEEPETFMSNPQNTQGEDVLDDANLRFMINMMYKVNKSQSEISNISNEKILMKNLKDPKLHPVTAKMMENILYLSPEQCGAHDANEGRIQVESLKGLEYATNLEYLSLNVQVVNDLTPIENCRKLKVLLVGNNNLKNIDALRNLENLEWIDIHGIHLNDINALSNLTKLKHLDMKSCTIRDLTPLKNLTNMEWIDASINSFDNIEALSNLTNLRYLNIAKTYGFKYGNAINGFKPSPTVEDISYLANMTKMKELDISDNNISDISALSNMKELVTLSANENNISDWKAIYSLKKLKNIQSNNNPNTPDMDEFKDENVSEGYQVSEILGDEININASSDEDAISKLPKTLKIKYKKSNTEKDYFGIYNKATIRYVIKDKTGAIVKNNLRFELTPRERADNIKEVSSNNGYLDVKLDSDPLTYDISLNSLEYRLIGKHSFKEEFCPKGFFLNSITKNDKTLETDPLRPDDKKGIFDTTKYNIPEEDKDLFVLTVESKNAEGEDSSQVSEDSSLPQDGLASDELLDFVIKDVDGSKYNGNLNVTIKQEDGAEDLYKEYELKDGHLLIHDSKKANPGRYIINITTEDGKRLKGYKAFDNDKYNTTNHAQSFKKVFSGSNRYDYIGKIPSQISKDDGFMTLELEKLPTSNTNNINLASYSSFRKVEENDTDSRVKKVDVKWKMDPKYTDKDTGVLLYRGELDLDGIDNPDEITAIAHIRLTNPQKHSSSGKDSYHKCDYTDDDIENKKNYIVNESIKLGNRTIDISKGSTRVETSIALSKKYYTKSDTVILVGSNSYSDALVASPLSAKYSAPILLVGKSGLDKEHIKEINRLSAKNVIVIGGEESISKASLDKLKDKVTRISGKDRYDTAIKVYDLLKLENSGDEVILASGENFADALSATNFSTEKLSPILLSAKNTIKNDTIKKLNESKKIVLVGGEKTISNKVTTKINKKLERIAGNDRYETSVKIASYIHKKPIEVALASGENFADAVVSSSLVSKIKIPLVLTKRYSTPISTIQYISGANNLKIVGGESSIDVNQFK